MYSVMNYIVITVVGLVVLGIMFYNTQKKRNIYFVGQMPFRAILIFVALILVFDLGMYLFDKKTFAGARELNIMVSFLYFLFSPVPGLFMVLYINERLNRAFAQIKFLIPLLLFPIIVNAFACILSLWFDVIFVVSPENVYSRGSLMWIMAVCSYFDILVSFILMLIYHNETSKEEILAMMSFIVLPVFCTILQMMFFGLAVLWIGVTGACLMTFVFSLNDSMRLDPLTGLYSRRQLEQHLYIQFKKKDKKQYLIGIMLDLNKFKRINDTYGHAEGDCALERASGILKRAFKKEAFIARYAGDEFVVVIESNSNDISKFSEELMYEENLFNRTSNLPYKLKFSMGTVVSLRAEDENVTSFLQSIDKKMYEDKRGSNEKE